MGVFDITVSYPIFSLKIGVEQSKNIENIAIQINE